jgi:three-Cys-motif partner protein
MDSLTRAPLVPKVDLAAYKDREQAYVKHYLLEKYLAPLAYKVGSKWDSIVYIDAFSGPWQTTRPNYTDSSFGIAIETLRDARAGLLERGRSLRIELILVEEDKRAFAALEEFAAKQSADGFGVHALNGEFVAQIPTINRLIRERAPNPFKFVFLDPKGWADIPMLKMQHFLKGRSGEVVINLMTRHIIRFLGEQDRADSYHNLFGRNEVLDLLNTVPRENNERAEQAVREYCRSLKKLCGFKYVSSAVILEPDQESVKYYLIYATNDFHGIDVFKAAERAAARIQDQIRYSGRGGETQQTELFLVGGSQQSRLASRLYSRYRSRAFAKVLEMLRASDASRGVEYTDLYCEAMAFPLVGPEDLVGWIRELEPNVKLVLSGSPKRKKPSPGENDRVTVKDASVLNRVFSV